MTSEEIKSMQSAAAIDAANVVGKNDATYTNVMRNIYLAEIAYQLAVANEREAAKAAREVRWECPRCRALRICPPGTTPFCPNDHEPMVPA